MLTPKDKDKDKDVGGCKGEDAKPPFAELAGILNMSRSTLYDLRRRDRRFPDRGTKGWPVYAVVHLLIVRDLEEQTDAEFNAEARRRCRDVLFRLEVGRGGGDCRKDYPQIIPSKASQAVEKTSVASGVRGGWV